MLAETGFGQCHFFASLLYKGVFVSWGADLEGDIVQTFGQFTQQDCLSKRLTDVFGLFGYLQFLVKKQDQLFLAS